MTDLCKQGIKPCEQCIQFFSLQHGRLYQKRRWSARDERRIVLDQALHIIRVNIADGRAMKLS